MPFPSLPMRPTPMDILVFLTYSLFLLSIAVGLGLCWCSALPRPQKGFWSVVIVTFPVVGTLLYCAIAKQTQDLFQ